jgi:hypothetical protein
VMTKVEISVAGKGLNATLQRNTPCRAPPWATGCEA